MKKHWHLITMCSTAPFLGFKGMTAGYKISSIILTSFLLSPLAWVADVMSHHVIISPSFIKILVVALFVDVATGMMKHWKLRSFDWKDLLTGFMTKVAISFMGMALFNALSSMEDFDVYQELRNYFLLVGRLSIFLYVGGSAFTNMYVVSNGKFPPLAWMQRMKSFGTSLSLSEFVNKNNPTKTEKDLLDELLDDEKKILDKKEDTDNADKINKDGSN